VWQVKALKTVKVFKALQIIHANCNFAFYYQRMLVLQQRSFFVIKPYIRTKTRELNNLKNNIFVIRPIF